MTLGNVVDDRWDGLPKLSGKSESLVRGKGLRLPIDRDAQPKSLPPHHELSKRSHARNSKLLTPNCQLGRRWRPVSGNRRQRTEGDLLDDEGGSCSSVLTV